MNDLETLNLTELKQLARDMDIPNRSKLRKAELILALLKARQPELSAAKAGGEGPVARAEAPFDGETLGSSASSQVDEAPAEKPEWGPTGDPGLPIPDQYGVDKVSLLVQDPTHLYAWWEFTGSGLAAARAALGEDGTPVLVVYGPNGPEQREIDLAGCSYWLTVTPQTDYRVDIALRDRNGNLQVLASSSPVSTPSAGISENLDEEWMAVDVTFQELVERAGLEDGQFSSVDRFRSTELMTRLWTETKVTPMFSGSIFGPPPGGGESEVGPGGIPEHLSSHVLGSHSLGSHSLGSHSLSSDSLLD
jgi:hypothetical protein